MKEGGQVLTLTEVLNKFKECMLLPNNPTEGLDEIYRLMDQNQDYFVGKLDLSMVYSERLGERRVKLFKTLRVAGLLFIGEDVYILVAPASMSIKSVLFVSWKPREIEIRIKDGEAVCDTPPAMEITDITKENVTHFYVELSDIKPDERIDYAFYDFNNVESVKIEKMLKGAHALEDLADVRCGYHTNFKQTSIAAMLGGLIDVLPDLQSVRGLIPVSFYSIENLSSIGRIDGSPFAHFLKRKPKTPPANNGDIIMSLVGTRGQKGKINDTLGQVAIIEKDGDYYVNQTFAIITPKKGINPYFLLLSLGADYFKYQLRKYKKPLSKYQTMVTIADIRKMRVIIPENAKEMSELGRKQEQWIVDIRKALAEKKELSARLGR